MPRRLSPSPIVRQPPPDASGTDPMATEPTVTTSASGRAGRRAVLTGLLGTLSLAVTACDASTSSPAASGFTEPSPAEATRSTSASGSAASGATSTSPSASATSASPRPGGPSVDWSALRGQAQTSAALFAGAAAPGLKDATPAFRSWAAAAASMSAQQAARLGLSDPLSGASVTPPSPAATRLASMADATKRISAQQQAVAAHCVQMANQAGSGDEALLLVSLAAAAHATATPGPAPTVSTLSPGHADLGPRTDALQVLLSHLEATIEGYERGAGRLAANDTAGLTSARNRINQLSALRDTTQSAVARAGATPAPPVLGYAMPGGFGSAAAIRQTWGRLELSLLDAWARVAAASTGRDRSTAIGQVLSQADAARVLGVAVSTWPGWTLG